MAKYTLTDFRRDFPNDDSHVDIMWIPWITCYLVSRDTRLKLYGIPFGILRVLY